MPTAFRAANERRLFRPHSLRIAALQRGGFMADPKHIHGKAHTIHRQHQHMSWDNARPPAITIAPGDTVDFRDIDAMCGQITPESTAEVMTRIDFGKVNPIAGPVYVDGAAPGDTL